MLVRDHMSEETCRICTRRPYVCTLRPSTEVAGSLVNVRARINAQSGECAQLWCNISNTVVGA